MIKKSLTLLLIGSLMLSMTACTVGSESSVPASTEEIELIDPVNAEISFEEVATRTLYDTTVYGATVMPYIEEYSSDYTFRYGYYGAFYGDTVKKGQELILADTENIDEQIKAKKDKILTMEEEYDDYVKDRTEDLEEKRALEARFEREMKKNEREKPQEYIEEDGEKIKNPDYETWEYQYNFNVGQYRIAKNDGDIIQREMDQKKALLDMDLKHERYLLSSLQKSRKNATVTSGMDGEIVAIKTFDDQNSYVVADEVVVAVGNMSQKILRCDYVNKNVIKNAKDIYALIDGKRYELEYHPISSDEYARLSAIGKVYSTFTLLNAGEEVNIGDYAVITICVKELKDVVSIPKAAIKKDDVGSYVYVLQNGKNVYTSIQTGYSDGIYTEVVSGLSAGDKILYTPDQKVTAEKTQKLTKGNFSTSFSNSAQLRYPFRFTQYNTIENGTVYFGEYQVERFKHVDKGDVIATIRVEPDNLALKRNETRLSRLRERMADYQEKHKEDKDEDYYKEAIENYQEQIKDLEDAIKEQKTDFGTKQILADQSGVVVRLGNYEKEDIVQRDAFIVQIADESCCYVEVEDKNQILQYGNEVEIVFKTYDMEQGGRNSEIEHRVKGTVANMSRMGVSSALQTDYKEILLPQGELENVLQGSFFGDWWDQYRYTVEGNVRTMENVVMIPRSAVYDYGGGKTYVYVKDENGNAKAQSFISGGSNESYYWVAQGLAEGTEICLK